MWKNPLSVSLNGGANPGAAINYWFFTMGDGDVPIGTPFCRGWKLFKIGLAKFQTAISKSTTSCACFFLIIFTKWFSFSCVEHFGKQQMRRRLVGFHLYPLSPALETLHWWVDAEVCAGLPPFNWHLGHIGGHQIWYQDIPSRFWSSTHTMKQWNSSEIPFVKSLLKVIPFPISLCRSWKHPIRKNTSPACWNSTSAFLHLFAPQDFGTWALTGNCSFWLPGLVMWK